MSMPGSVVGRGVARPVCVTLSGPVDASPAAAVHLRTFNQLDRATAVALLRACLDADRWVTEILDGRPYPSLEALLDAARAVPPLSPAEVTQVYVSLPEPGSVSQPVLVTGSTLPWPAAETQDRADLVEQLVTYRRRFGRSFLIRTAGRSWDAITAKLSRRLSHSPEQEDSVIAAELRQIALLRLVHLIRI